MVREQVVAIIGGGIAGITAASYLMRSGIKPVIIARGAGATALFSGGYDLGTDRTTRFQIHNQRTALQNLIERIQRGKPAHPYHQISSAETVIQNGFQLLERYLKLNLSPLSMTHQELLLPLQWGGMKRTALVARINAGGDLDQIKSRGKLGIAFFHQFYPFASKVLLEQYQELVPDVVPLRLNFLKRYHDTSYQTYDFAHNFEKSGAFERFMEHLSRGVETTKIKTLIVPPFLGVDSFEQFTERISKSLKLNICETLATRPSIPGIRLQRKIDQFIKQHDLELIRGRVTGFHKQGRNITRLLISGKEEIKLPVSGVFFAPGKIVGGGVVMGEQPHEPVFQLPLFYRNRTLNQLTYPVLKEQLFDQHPLFATGVKVDQNGRPIDRDGGIIFENLFAGGSILQGFDFRIGEGGMGVAVATAYHHAAAFERYLQEVME